MHEYSICRALLQKLETLCRQHRAVAVKRLTLKVAVLSGVEPQLLAAAFRAACADGCAREAELRIEMLWPQIRCQACGRRARVSPQRLSCPTCGAGQIRLISGDQLLLCDADLTDEEPAPCATTAAAH